MCVVVCRPCRQRLGQRPSLETLAARVKTLIGVTVTVEVVDPESVPRSLGKAVRLKDLRG